MDIDIIENPFVIKIENMFDNDTASNIFNEAIGLESTFSDAFIQSGVDKSYRNNTSSYYDVIFKDNRDSSILLSAIQNLFSDKSFNSVLLSSPHPMYSFSTTNTHETQVSRYGGGGGFYNWHVDSLGNNGRTITIVYYFNDEPKKYDGGSISISNSPILDGKLIMKNPNIITIQPKHNMAVIFSSNLAHRVDNTISSDVFIDGRFSANIWLGFK